MATPHGGSELARSLKRVMRVVGILSFKEYIRELVPGSETLEDLNRRFRSFAEELEIVSLCEGLPTWIGPVRLVSTSSISSLLVVLPETGNYRHRACINIGVRERKTDLDDGRSPWNLPVSERGQLQICYNSKSYLRPV